MPKRSRGLVLLSLCIISLLPACGVDDDGPDDQSAVARGPYAVGATNVRIADEFAGLDDSAKFDIFLGKTGEGRPAEGFAGILADPNSAWLTNVDVPADESLYGPAAGMTLPIVSFVAFPTRAPEQPNAYDFPYEGGRYGSFEHMLRPGEAPVLADADGRYPLLVLAHGSQSHGMYEVAHAQTLASHGYIVVAITYGDERTAIPDDPSFHVGFLRPLITRAVIDGLLASDEFGSQIDADNIGISGHSFGGFTALMVTGGPFLGRPDTVHDPRVKASVLAAPWVGGHYDGADFFSFGDGNEALSAVSVPTLCLFGTDDDVTLASFILPAMQKLSGPRYVVELVGQPHIFAPGSWDDKINWELVFFAAYLKNDTAALQTLRSAESMPGGNEDRQLLEYQRVP